MKKVQGTRQERTIWRATQEEACVLLFVQRFQYVAHTLQQSKSLVEKQGHVGQVQG
jgi:hypothetical protein